MTSNANRVLAAALIGAVLAVAAVLALGLSGGRLADEAGAGAAPVMPAAAADPVQASQDEFDRSLGEFSRVANAERDYLTGLRAGAPGLWSLPGATDTELTETGRLGCEVAAQNGGSWETPVGLMVQGGFSPAEAGVVTFQATRHLCPEQLSS